MAEPYLSDLGALAEEWLDGDPRVGALECRHFFSGAAAYRDGAIVASLTPVGLAFKVSAEVHDDLLRRELAVPLRYFSTGPIKENYVLFPPTTSIAARDAIQLLLGESIRDS